MGHFVYFENTLPNFNFNYEILLKLFLYILLHLYKQFT